MPATTPAIPFQVAPALERPNPATFRFEGFVAERLEANVEQWLLPALAANPAMLQILRDRDRTPPRELVPWAGEFAGKYLVSAVQALRLSGSPRLRAHLEAFVADLLACQNPDGYFGPFPAETRMMGPGLWDLWGQYHVMLGLFYWAQETGDPDALAACRRCADHFCAYFLDGGRRVVEAGWEEMNESSLHIFLLLYAETGEPRYLALAREIERDWETPPSGDYVRTALAGQAFWQTPKPRWESLHSVQAIAELYFLTGEANYRVAYERIWRTIAEGDRHNTGGFTSGEQATGNPYDPGAIETCCTIAWMCITQDYLRMTGESRAADELELSFWNAVLGAQAPSGRWWTYNTPMDGDRKASAHEIVFQARAGSPELNCCSVNGPRGLGVLSEWAAMTAPDGAALNYYGASEFALPTPAGQTLRLTQRTDYPREETVQIRLDLPQPERFTLRLRIPSWSQRATAQVNGEAQQNIVPGTYLVLTREWRAGDAIDLRFDLSPWFWVGEREAAGKISLYRGPLLLAYDPRFDEYDPTQLPTVLPELAPDAPFPPVPDPQPFYRVRFRTAEGGTITLCDFASAGAGGNRYVSWLPASGWTPAPFSLENPFRAVRAEESLP